MVLFAALTVGHRDALGQTSSARTTTRPTALDRYVAAPDSSYRYQLVATLPGAGCTAYVIELTSQTWRTRSEVDRSVWKHWLTVDGFVVAGGSKRGWTTWTTAAVDRRVVAIAPIVIDLLNIVPSFKHHLAVYGYYVPAVSDYETMGLLGRVDTPRYRELMTIEEPYQYRDRLTMPKFIINATGDQFFVPDSWQFYYRDLAGDKRLRYVPNADHSLGGSDVWTSLTAWYDAVLNGAPIPAYDLDDRPEGRHPGHHHGQAE